MKEIKFKVGDWIFCEFKLQQVKEMDGEKVTCVTDGCFQMSGSDLTDRCFPLEIDVKILSDNVAYWSKKFHELPIAGLNHPDLNRALISKWANACRNRRNQEVLSTLIKEIDKFGQGVVNKVYDLKNEEIERINVFR